MNPTAVSAVEFFNNVTWNAEYVSPDFVERLDDDGRQLILQHFLSVYPVNRWESASFFKREDLLGWVDYHWMKFDPKPNSIHFALAAINALFSLIGSASNGIVVYVICSTKKLLTPPNILIVNLALSDLLVTLMVPIFIFNSYFGGPAIGKLGCTVYGFVNGLAGTSAIMTLTAIAVDRCFAICRPMNSTKKLTRFAACVICLLVWVYSAAVAGLPLIGVGKYVPEGFLTTCCFDYLSTDWVNRTFILSFFLTAWVFPLLAIVSCYTLILVNVIRIRRDINETTDITNAVGPNLSVRHIINCHPRHQFLGRRAPVSAVNQPYLDVAIAKIVAGLIATWTVAWTPFAVVSLLGIAGYSHLITPTVALLPALLAKCASCFDPFIYALNHPKIRRHITAAIFRSSQNSRAGASSVGKRPHLRHQLVYKSASWRYPTTAQRSAAAPQHASSYRHCIIGIRKGMEDAGANP